MRSPIAESGRSGDTTNIKALSRIPANPGQTDDPCVISNFYGRYRLKSISNSTNIEYLQRVQNAVDNARQFEKESLGAGGGANIQGQKNIDGTTEMKTKLVKIDDEERSKGRGFMKRVKERWDLEFPELASASMHNLRNNASCFQKEPGMRNLILVRNRNEIGRQKDRVYEDPSNHQIVFKYEDQRDTIQNRGCRKQML